eukprot:2868680-Lingulodinium_polyedra.AAC.1
MQGLHRYEEAFNNSTNGRAPRCGILPLTFVSTVEEVGFECGETLGVLWPVAIYEARHGKPPANKI